MSNMKDDGRTRPYIPPVEPPASIAGELHRDIDQVDPTTFEVLRHALWNVLMEHGTTITRTSGSAVVVYSHDFNPVILDEWGDFVFIGPWLQYLVAASSPAAKWTMEHRHPHPGIEPGCMFMSNDPWIGATHQSDVSILAPVFVDGKIFAWVGNSLHHADLGGTAPGGFNPVAPDVFSESGVIPPIRIVENGEVRIDLEEEFLRRSRMPDVVAVDLRAQIAGCRVAGERLEELIERYGPAVIKGVMRKVQDDAESAFVRRLESVPDGEWSDEAFLEAATPGDRKVYRNKLTLRKKGERLEFSNEGTDPQIGSINCTLPAFIGSIAAMINTQLMFDQMFAVGGALRRIDFEAAPGTITSALHPSAVSLAVLTLDQCIALASLCISKMVSSSTDPELRKETPSAMGTSTFPVAAYSGTDAQGNIFANLFTEPMGAGMAAWTWRDGIDAGGWSWDPLVSIPNVEEIESIYPIMYLWREMTTDSGGAGRFRGGNAMEIGSVAWGVESVDHHTASAGHHALPLSPLFGGYTSDVHFFGMLRATDAADQFADGKVPTRASLDRSELEELPIKASGIRQGSDDVFTFRYCGAGGSGDPLQRDAELVAGDVRRGRVSSGEATRLYGVVLNDGELDTAASEARRSELLAARRSWTAPAGSPRTVTVGASGAWKVGPGLEVVAEADGRVLACESCGAVLSSLHGNWRDGALVTELPVEDGNRLCPPPQKLIDDDFVLRQFACPGCARLMDGEVRRRAEPPMWDLRIAEVN
jgi:N-methylhydantoinase B